MAGSWLRVVIYALLATILAGLLIGWTGGLVAADHVRETEFIVFLALGFLFLVAVIRFVAELARVSLDLA